MSHSAYKCTGSCCGTTDRPWKCGADSCECKGKPLQKQDSPVVYFCPGECKGCIFTPVSCGAGAGNCKLAGVPLEARLPCSSCAQKIKANPGQAFACDNCSKVIRTSKLPNSLEFSTDVSRD